MRGGWDKAYLQEASSDYDVFLRLLPMPVAACHKLHYLQMAAEKLSKAFLSMRAKGHRQPNVHESLVRFLKSVESHDAARRALGYGSKSQYTAFIRGVIPVARALEEVYPKGTVDRPNLEYPWERLGVISCPCDYAFSNLELNGSDVQARKFARFVEKCLKTAEGW